MSDVDSMTAPEVEAADRSAFAFRFDDDMTRWARLFRVTPTTSSVTVTAAGLEVRFGPWRLSTPWFNIVAVSATGPYRRWKVVGPARLSLGDRGVTFATTTDGGVCLSFRDPVGAIDPLGIVRHPNATVTVDDHDRFVAEVRARVGEASRRLVAVPTPRERRGTISRSISAVRRWARREHSVAVRSRDVDELFIPESADDDLLEDGQPISSGSGAWFHRRYMVTVERPQLDGVAAMARLRADLNVLVDEELAPLSKLRGESGGMALGDRFVVETAGPWSGPVEVTEVTERSLRLATLDGHMEAGLIEFAVAEDDDRLQFTIESWNRSSGRTIDALYDRLTVARDLQSEMWVQACERFVSLVGGAQSGPVDVETERAAER